MSDFEWLVKTSPEKKIVSDLAKSLNIHSTLAHLLVQRGADSYEKAKDFFRPDLSDLHDPFLMKDMDLAIERIEKAFGDGERILIYGDYDVDGTTAVSLVYSFFSKIYDNIDFYIPDRYNEGYGISFKGIDYASESNVSLIISLDCGIKAIEKVEYANKKGIDFIICDHHTPGNKLPEAVAVLDPKRNDCSYPYDELCGCGIGFKLVQGFSEKNGYDFEALHEYLDLVAISIGCDIVPITGENRILAFHGLTQLNSFPRTGLRSMLELAEVKKPLTITDLVFVIGPRINAAGRIDHAKKAVELLLSSDEKEAIRIGKLINQDNSDRKDLDRQITLEALQMIEEDQTMRNAKSCVLSHPSWHKGVIGIVASRVIETHYRPTIILTEKDGVATGSARSVRGFNVYNAIDSCSSLLDQYGGHKYAAGLTLKTSKIDAFRKLFEENVSKNITEDQLIPKIDVDMELSFQEINKKFYRILSQFAPFGPGNMRPTFVSHNVYDTGKSRRVGANGDHLKLDLFQKNDPDITFSGIAFNMGHLYDKICSNNPFSIAYSLDENEWNGRVTLQLKVRDIKHSKVLF